MSRERCGSTAGGGCLESHKGVGLGRARTSCLGGNGAVCSRGSVRCNALHTPHWFGSKSNLCLAETKTRAKAVERW